MRLAERCLATAIRQASVHHFSCRSKAVGFLHALNVMLLVIKLQNNLIALSLATASLVDLTGRASRMRPTSPCSTPSFFSSSAQTSWLFQLGQSILPKHTSIGQHHAACYRVNEFMRIHLLLARSPQANPRRMFAETLVLQRAIRSSSLSPRSKTD